MAMPKRWAVREAAIASFYDLDTEALIVSLNTLKMTEVQTTGETVYAMGGRGNAKLVAFSGNREANVTIQDAIFDNDALSMLTGNAVNSAYAATLKKVHQAPYAATITVPDTAITVTGVRNLTQGTTLALTTGYTVASPVVTIVSGATAGDIISIAYTIAVTGATQVKVTSDKFAGTYKLVCDIIVRDELTAKDYYGQFIAPKVKINDEFTFNFSPDGDPSVLDIPVEILKPSSGTTMWELVIYDEV